MILPNLTRAGCSANVLAVADLWDEAELLRAIMERAGALGWRRMHSEPVLAQNRRGGFRHVTPFTGDAGWPDLVAVSPAGVLVVAELKRETGSTTREQREWLARLQLAPGVLAGVWRPRDWHAHLIDRVLRDPTTYLEAA